MPATSSSPPIPLPNKVAALLLLGAGSLLASSPPALGAAYEPAGDAVVLERLPALPGGAAAALRALKARAAADPTDLAAALPLAERLFALGQSRQDPRYVGQARAALEPWWGSPDAPAPALVLRAAIRQHRHEFGAALADLDQALATDPGDPRALATRAAVLLVQGRPADAAEACERLRAAAARPVVGATCAATALARSGRAEAGYALLEEALASAGPLGGALEAWARTGLAEIAEALGRPEAAEAQYRLALRADPADAYAVNGLADLLLDRGRPAEVVPLVGGDLANDGKLLRVALALRATGSGELATHAGLLEARFAAAGWRGDSVHRREEARFRLHVKGEAGPALRLAEENWRDQREPWDARLLLEAAVAADEPAAAGPVTAWLRETGYQDRRLAPLLDRLPGDRG